MCHDFTYYIRQETILRTANCPPESGPMRLPDRIAAGPWNKKGRAFLLCSSLLVVILAFILARAVPRLELLSTHFAPRTSTTMGSFFSKLSGSSSSSSSSSSSTSATTKNMSYAKELEVAQLAVQRATILTKRVFHEKAKGTVDKNDKSPVTIGDFGAQALIIAALKASFPDDEIVAEEEAAGLQENAELRKTVWDLVKATKLDDAAAEKTLGGEVKTEDDMLKFIDYGNSKGGASGRIWAIDPIDGTKGFLRGGQYAVCLALMVDGEVAVGVLGCPNLPVDDSAPLTADIGKDATDEGRGVIFSAVLGQGATSRPLSTAGLEKERSISMRPITDLTAATFCESVEAGHSSHGDQADIATKLGITNPSVRMDSQAKYASIARGAGDIYLRLPTSKTYQEKIWDHAAGDLIVREAGGEVTDVQGKRLDFKVGRTLANNKGVVAAPSATHAQVLKAVQEVLKV